ncbi:alpha/beta fold hydrolase [Agromyces sp. CFH 90414]|uniref:Alpha/beta fold hydrolase n=1 Tax=Agromyces agglutinans TaxID=2662258 RepID=A0A6I2F9S1_9MICO|nr:alpha/beta hydrolase [Agromyces agglutinans]MRG59460.1 alpha/beta fold hydrolase [Agromyces agglutinans]
MQTFTARDGRTIAHHLIGSGTAGEASAGVEPALVVPGGACRGVEYLEDLAGAASVRSLAVLHPRGTPSTGGRSRGWWTDADDLVDLADHLGLAQVDVVAHSAGTRLALAAAVRYPERIRSLTLVTPPAMWLTGTPWDGRAIADRRADPELEVALASLLGADPVEQADFERHRVVEGPAGYAKWTDRERAHVSVGDWELAADLAWFEGIPDDAADRVREASLPPVTVIAGDGDLLVGVAPVVAYAELLHAELVMLAECGHYPWVEQPEAFRAALGRALARDTTRA